MTTDAGPVKISFSFYPADMQAMTRQVAALQAAGVPVRRGTLLRALIHLTPPAEMIMQAAILAGSYAQKLGPREDDMVAGHPTVDLPRAHVRKLDDVVTHLDRRGISANRAFIVRAILRAAPAGRTLAPTVRKFLKDFPAKPSGWTARNAKRKNA